MTTRKKVLVTAPYFMPVVEQYRARLEAHGCELIVHPVNERAEEDELLAVIADIDGVICGDDRFTARVLAAAPRLKAISKWGTGIDSIDQDACRRRGVRVLNTPNAFTVPVADSVVAYALAFARNIVRLDQAMKQGVWDKVPGASLAERTVGIIGVGNIGQRVARCLAPFGATLLGHDIKPIPGAVQAETGLRSVDRDTLLRQSDIVSVNCDLNPTSHHLIRADTLALMKPTAVLINTARGPIVKEADLVAALACGRLAGAALDVFEHEPLPADSPLRQMPHVLLSPHNTNSSPAAWARVHESTVQNLVDALAESA